MIEKTLNFIDEKKRKIFAKQERRIDLSGEKVERSVDIYVNCL